MKAPWEYDKLPPAIRTRDLDDAARYFTSGILWRWRRIVPLHPERYGWYFRLSGTHYPANVPRIRRLAAARPICSDDAGLYYPGLLLPDPVDVSAYGQDDSEYTPKPVAVCSYTGYIGSAWQSPATEIRPEVDKLLEDNRLLATRIQLIQEDSGVDGKWMPRVWLPCDEWQD